MKYILLNKDGYIEGISFSDIKPTYATTKIPPKVFFGMINKFNYERDEWEQELKEIPEYDEFSYNISLGYDGWEKEQKGKYKERSYLNSSYKYFIYKISILCQDLIDSDEEKERDASIKEITVLIPCYNKSLFIMETIDSVLKQTVLPKKIEILLMDEKSIAMKDDILKKSDLISVEICEKKDIVESRNYLVDKCKTKDFIFLDADDLLYENFIEECSKIDCYFVFPPSSIKNNDYYSKPFKFTKSLCYNALIGNMTGIINKDKFIEIGKLDPVFNKIHEDYDLRLRAIMSNYAVGFPETTSYYMRRDDNKDYKKSSILFSVRNLSENFNIIKKHSKYLLDTMNRIEYGKSNIAKVLIKYFNALINRDFSDKQYEILYQYFNMIENSGSSIDFSKAIETNKLYKNISWISNDLPEIISSVPYNLFKEIEIKHETNNAVSSKEDITICLYANNYSEKTIDSIESIIKNEFKNIIILSNNNIDLIKEKYPFITIIENNSSNIREASKIMAKQSKTDWMLFTDTTTLFIDTSDWIDEITANTYDVLFLKGSEKTLITFKQYFEKNNSCIIHKDLFNKTNGFSNDYDFTLDCYKNGKCDFTVYPLINAFIPSRTEFILNLKFYETLKKHKDIIDDIIKIYKKYPSSTRKNANIFMKNVFKEFDDTYDFLNKILLED